MDAIIKDALKTKLFSRTGRGGGGCISEGEGYNTDNGMVFVKRNSGKEARRMFDSEYEGLKAIMATNTVRVPKPLVVLDNPKGGAIIVLEFVEMSSLSRHAAKLGEQLARMHLHNEEQRVKCEERASDITSQRRDEETGENVEPYVSKFGFHCTTCCGYIPQDNTWCDDWVEFYTRQKLQAQINLLEKEKTTDRELQNLWPQVQLKIPEFFKDIEVRPALLHGDLWGGNAAESSEGPVIFDPAAFYGHSEFDLAIAKMFGGFGSAFFQAYHSVIPKAPGFETRHQLYQLFHYLNHWNHFGSGYRGSSISIMRRLVGK